MFVHVQMNTSCICIQVVLLQEERCRGRLRATDGAELDGTCEDHFQDTLTPCDWCSSRKEFKSEVKSSSNPSDPHIISTCIINHFY